MEEQFIGSYKIIKKIGSGGMAKVYLAVHQDVPNLKVILKILSDPRLGERFRHEADKLALLDGHSHICRIKHFFNHGEDTVIAMEYIDGITLDEKIKNEGKLPTEESLQIISDVLDILDFAHQKGICHRDIKPSNIMIDKKGQVKIIDFGIAKAETDPNLTVAGSACGTPAYMAPEQFTPTQDTNYTLVDIYAAGTTLYTILTGECPFKGDNEFAIRDAKLFSKVTRPRSLNPDIPKQVEDIIMKSLAKEPEERFQSATEMRTALDAIRSKTQDRDQPRPPEMTIEIRRPPKRKTAKPLRLVAALAVVAIAAFAVYYFAFRGEETGGMEISIVPYGDVYVNDSLVGENVSAASFTGLIGTHVIRVHNEESIEKILYDTIWLAADTILPLAFEFSMYAPTGEIGISVTPYGDIYVDDSFLGKGITDASVTSDTGTHIIRVENRNATRKVLYDTVLLAADQTVRRSFRFTIPTRLVDTPEPEPTYRNVIIVSKPRGADVYIDGELQEQKTNYTFKFEPGEHIIRVRLTTLEGEELERQDTILVNKAGPDKVVFDFDK